MRSKGSFFYLSSFFILTLLLFIARITLVANADQKIARSEAEGPVKGDLPDRYAINLQSTIVPVDREALPALDLLNQYKLYSTTFKKDGKVWYRWRLGFFASKRAAKQVLSSLVKKFPYAWVTKVSIKERMEVELNKVVIFSPQKEPYIKVDHKESPVNKDEIDKKDSTPSMISKKQTEVSEGDTVNKEDNLSQEIIKGDSSPQLSDVRLTHLMDEAETAMINGDYKKAILLYTKILQYPDHNFSQDAKEFLGLARERNGQMAHAIAEYEEYLRLYPEGEGADRVRQRLAGILTARAQSGEKLREAKRIEKRGKWSSEFFGSFSQFYSRDVSFTEPEGKTVNQSALDSDLDINAHLQSDEYEVDLQFIGGYEKDFLDDDESKSRLNTFYIDVLDGDRLFSGRFGRQSRSTGGVLGRFDGALLSYQYLKQVRVVGALGFPVESTTSISIETGRRFYGLSLDLGTFAEKWDFNTFFINQEVDGIIDRRAIGGEIRYINSIGSFFGLIDYDISYNELNTVLLTGNLTSMVK